jgi:predicted small lipoprotein YifL
MALRTIALLSISVLLAGCGRDGPSPTEKKDAEGNPGASAPSSTAVADSPQAQQRWSFDPDLRDKLAGPELDPVHGVYHLRPPAGWKFTGPTTSQGRFLKTRDTELNGQGFSGYWESPRTGCRLSLSIEVISDDALTRLNLDEGLVSAMASFGGFMVKKESLDTGRIGALDFTRFRYTASSLIIREERRSVRYMAKDGNRFLTLSVVAPITGWEEEFRLAENAILTLTK